MAPEINAAEIAVNVAIHKKFTYFIPKHIRNKVETGSRVLVPFGSRKLVGYIMSLRHERNVTELKDIVNVLDEIPLFSKTMVPILFWVADYYIYPIGKLIRAILPPGLDYSSSLKVEILNKGKHVLKTNSVSKLEAKVLYLVKHSPKTTNEIKIATSNKATKSLLSNMEEQQLIRLTNIEHVGKIKLQRATYISHSIDYKNHKLGKQRKKILSCLKKNGDMILSDLINKAKTSRNLIQKMEKDDQIKIYSSILHKKKDTITKPEKKLKLTQKEKDILNAIGKLIGKSFKVFLLDGNIESNKIEMYIRLAKIALELNLSILILVPEIISIFQLQETFKANFKNKVAILHSKLPKTKIHTNWLRIIKEKTIVSIGTRSCVFAPINNLGLIIVDDEHDPSYKHKRAPFYNAQNVAIMRAKFQKAIVLLTSKTPSIQSWFNAQNGKFTRFSISDNKQKQTTPIIDIVDISHNKDSEKTNKYLSNQLIKQMIITLNKGEQILLFLNKRGSNFFSLCSKCGKLVLCKKCDVSLTLHRISKLLICHHCGFSIPSNTLCSYCNSSSIRSIGIGTEKLEMIIKKKFPRSNIARIDKDTASKNKTILKTLKSIRNHEIDILIGTQMMIKKYNLPKIRLIGIICVDLTMNFPDFLSVERTFQLMSHIKRLIKQDEIPGRLILQTYNPTHFSVMAIKEGKYTNFYATEIMHRKLLKYPPFSRIAQITISGKNESKVASQALYLQQECKMLRSLEVYKDEIEILGPVEMPLAKINDFHRWQIMLKSSKVKRLNMFLKQLITSKTNKSPLYVKISINVDPVTVM